MKILLLSLILICIASVTYSQHLYIYVSNGDIYEVNADYSLSIQSVVNYPGFISDIAISPAGIMYAVADYELIQIDIITGNAIVINDVPATDHYVSLVCDENYQLYMITSGQNLYLYNILADSLGFVANLGDFTPGDLTFYKGNLIYQSSVDGNIKAYNLQNGTQSTIQCLIPPLSEGTQLWGLSNLFETCDAGKIFAIDNLANLYELDPENGSIHLRTHYDIFDALAITGMASTTEYLASVCDHTFENIECTTSIGDTKATPALINMYPNPAQESLMIDSKQSIDHISIFNLSGSLLKNFSPQSNHIDVSDLNSGIYFFRINVDRQVVNKKIVIR
ncbi:MAG TPA: T9SS type A sorting domain-containing protein [Saprospiraceae bacterium]|nr:T9SS type A sorting domain-containing protein [Saprospiraceae bacterium]